MVCTEYKADGIQLPPIFFCCFLALYAKHHQEHLIVYKGEGNLKRKVQSKLITSAIPYK